MILRYFKNPILQPNPNNTWENFAVFNGTIILRQNKYYLVYRAMGEETSVGLSKLRPSCIGVAVGRNKYDFTDRQILIKPEKEWEKFGCEDPRLTFINGKFYIFYTALGSYPFQAEGIKTAVAVSDNLTTIKERHLVTPFNAKAMTLFPEKINGRYVVLLTVNTDRPPAQIGIAFMDKLNTLWNWDFWNAWYSSLDAHILDLRRINSDQVEIGAPPIKTKDGWLLIHSYIKNYFGDPAIREFRIEAVLLDLENPQKIIGRIDKPLLTPCADYEIKGVVAKIVFPSGALLEDNQVHIYYGAGDRVCALGSITLKDLMSQVEINTPMVVKFSKFKQNPLLEPKPENNWENKAVFNPAALEIDNKFYLIYRALSEKNISSFGLAISFDGQLIDERLNKPIFVPRISEEKPFTPDVGSGVEDPRITRIANRLYLCYTAYDGQLPRLAFSSILVSDFVKYRWQNWSSPIIISPPGVPDKDGVLFPEKIKGEYVFIHRIEPNIVVGTVTDLSFTDKKFLEQKAIILPRTGLWDGLKIGINTVPIKTAHGWLVFYHGISQIDKHYRVGALLLKLDDPAEILARTPYPILEPETDYERYGLVDNVVFPCGSIVKNNKIYLYYGAADKVIGGAIIDFEKFLNYMVKLQTKKYLLSI